MATTNPGAPRHATATATERGGAQPSVSERGAPPDGGTDAGGDDDGGVVGVYRILIRRPVGNQATLHVRRVRATSEAGARAVLAATSPKDAFYIVNMVREP